MPPIGGRVVKLVSSGIGLGTEAYAAHKRRTRSPGAQVGPSEASSASQSQGLPAENADVSPEEANRFTTTGNAVPTDNGKLAPPDAEHPAYRTNSEDDDDTSSINNDEHEWDLDDTVSELSTHDLPPAYGDTEGTQHVDADSLVRGFMAEHPQRQTIGKLPCPVIIPQRRPGTKSRGFVRAYAPVLDDCGIDEKTFMDFNKTFHKSTQASPWFSVMFVAGHLVGYIPSATAMAISIPTQFIAGTAIELQRRQRTNSFLDQMNEKLFKPHGLYALIMCYNNQQQKPGVTHGFVDINQQTTKLIAQYDQPESGSTMSKVKNQIRNQSGMTYGEEQMAEAAPLVYPDLDDAADDVEKQTTTKDVLKTRQKFLADYYDRRAQAQYAYENPDSSLTIQEQPKFASRFADPNHPVNNGSLVSLITGGKVNPRAVRERRRQEFRRRTGRSPQRRGLLASVRRRLRPGALYLMITNLPSEEELQMARQTLAAEEADKEGK